MENLIKVYKNKQVFMLLILTCITTILGYMIIPFIALYTVGKGTISIAEAGMIVGCEAIASSAFSMLSGKISDRIGFKKTLSIGLIVTGISYIAYVYANTFLECLLLIILAGIGQALLNPIMKSLIAVSKNNLESDYIFRIRYMVLCICIIVGPILGNILSIVSVNFIFLIVGLFHVILIPFVIKLDINQAKSEVVNKSDKFEIHGKINMKLVYVIIIQILVFSVFSVFESATPLALDSYISNSEQMYSVLIIINSILALIIQPIIIKLNEKIDMEKSFSIGCILFMLAYVFFGMSNGKTLMLLIATVIFTFGESVLIPLLDVIIDKLSSKEEKTTFFAFAELKQIGFFIGPSFTALVIEKLSSSFMYYIVAFLCVVVLFVFRIVNRKVTETSYNIAN